MEEIRFNVDRARAFSALQRAENSSMRHLNARCPESPSVSVLFSEPKIPQSRRLTRRRSLCPTFSALQRAENSSIGEGEWARVVDRIFQCSSASRKFLNLGLANVGGSAKVAFQCSSASRKFLNPSRQQLQSRSTTPFQCSSASRKFLNLNEPGVRWAILDLSVLFSEPKIPQCVLCPDNYSRTSAFSALQRAENSSIGRVVPSERATEPFSALQRAENSSIEVHPRRRAGVQHFQCSSASRKFLNRSVPRSGETARVFQCSSASRKFLNLLPRQSRCSSTRLSVLFSEPKIPQCLVSIRFLAFTSTFSALQRAENSSIPRAGSF